MGLHLVNRFYFPKWIQALSIPTNDRFNSCEWPGSNQTKSENKKEPAERSAGSNLSEKKTGIRRFR
jgi:hypothetical protein